MSCSPEQTPQADDSASLAKEEASRVGVEAVDVERDQVERILGQRELETEPTVAEDRQSLT